MVYSVGISMMKTVQWAETEGWHVPAAGYFSGYVPSEMCRVMLNLLRNLWLKQRI